MIASDAINLLAERAAATEAMAENIPSPCVSVCRMDAQRQVCEGCLRSIAEIRVWSASSDSEKKTIWAHIAQRIEALAPAASTAP